MAAALAVLLPLAVHHGRRLTMLTLGDETAALHGVPVERSRLVLLGVGVALAAVATAAAGPVAFIALAAPQLAVRLTRSSGSGLLPAAAMGALLLVASDWVAQRALPGSPLPVGSPPARSAARTWSGCWPVSGGGSACDDREMGGNGGRQPAASG